MTFAELKQELADRGFDGILTDPRLGSFINRALVQLDGRNLWPYREATTTGSAPLAIADLGVPGEVIDVTTSCPLSHRSLPELQAAYGDMTVAGAPCFWYVTYTSGTPTFNTFPTTTGQITVQYWKTTTALSDDADEPLVPEGYRMLLVDMAAVMAYKDSDNFTSAQALQADVDRQVQDMTAELLNGYGQVVVPLNGVDC